MPRKNLVIFLVVMLAVLVGWQMFSSWRWPPKEKPPSAEHYANAARVVAACYAAHPGLDDVARIVTDWRVARLTPGEISELAAKSKQEVKPAVAKVEEKPKPKPKAKPQRKAEDIVLGEDSFFLKVTLTSAGAGIRELILTRFKEANRYGLYAGPQMPLIPNTNLLPSFLLYHYNPDEPASKDQQPWDTLGKLVWNFRKTTETGEQHVIFETPPEWDQATDIHITKIFTLKRDDYHLGLSIKLRSTRAAGGKALKFRYQLAGPRGLPIEGEWYTTTFRNALFGWEEEGANKTRSASRELEESRQIALLGGGGRQLRPDKEKIIRYAAVSNQYFASAIVVDLAARQPTKRDNFVEWARATLEQQFVKGRIRKIAGDNSFFELVGADKAEYTFYPSPTMTGRKIDELQHTQEITVVYTKIGDRLEAVEIDTGDDERRMYFEDITVRVASEVLELAPGAEVEHKYLLYNGPVKVRLLNDLEGVSEASYQHYMDDLQLSTFTDQSSSGFFGTIGKYTLLSDATIFFTNRMHGLLRYLHKVIPSYGVCIILLTVIVRGLMFPISRRQTLNSRKMQEKMKKLAPELKQLKEKYKNDFAGMSQAQQELYRRHGINPFSQLGGCLLLFLQMPIFLGLYYGLQESIHFRLESFLTNVTFGWWIRNLAAPDMLIWWSEYIPLLSNPDSHGGFLYLGPYFNILPVIAVALMMVQQKLTMPPPTDEQTEFSMKMMKWMMVVMGIMFYKMPAGLCIYFIATSLWGFAERKLVGKASAAGQQPAATSTKPETRKPETDGRRPKPTNGAMQKVSDWWHDLLKNAAKDPQARKRKK